jgi:hypothetical protein
VGELGCWFAGYLTLTLGHGNGPPLQFYPNGAGGGRMAVPQSPEQCHGDLDRAGSHHRGGRATAGNVSQHSGVTSPSFRHNTPGRKNRRPVSAAQPTTVEHGGGLLVESSAQQQQHLSPVGKVDLLRVCVAEFLLCPRAIRTDVVPISRPHSGPARPL